MARNLVFAFIGIVLMVEAVPPKVKIGALLAFNSTIGNAALAAMQLAIQHINQNDTILNGTLLELKAYDTHCNAFHGAAAAIALMGEEVAAIAGPQTSEASQFVAHMAGYTQVPLVSFSATDPTLSASLYKYFLRVAPSDNFHMEAIARLVSRFEWREVVALHTDDQFGTNGIDMLNNALQQVGATIAHRSAFDPRINRTEINEALADYVDMGARIFVVHMNPNVGRVVLVEAYNLMMLATGYAWIMTEAISSVLESIYHDHSFLQATQGIIGTHSYVQHSQQWKNFMQEMKDLTNIHANIYSLYAYDTIWTIAQAIHKFLNMNGSFTFLPPSLFHANSDLGKLKIFEQGPILQQQILASEFTGVSGKIRFDAYGDVPDCTLVILNMLGKKPRAVGSWTMRHGLSFELPQLPTSAIESPPSLLSQRGPPVEKAASIIWPGGTSRVPRGWLIPRGGRPLLIGVPNKQGYTEFVQIKFDKANNHATFHGFCIEVFKAALAYLPYTVPYSFVSYGDGHATPSYDELVRKVERKEFDAAVGDITITTERTQIVDFTQPYTTSGLVVVVPVKRIGGSTEAWSFLKPFTVGMWCTTVAFFLFTGLVIFLLEHKKNPDFRGGAKKEIVTTLWSVHPVSYRSY